MDYQSTQPTLKKLRKGLTLQEYAYSPELTVYYFEIDLRD